MSRTRGLFVAVATIFRLACACAEQVPTATTACELKTAPEKFNGQLVEVRGEVVGGIHISGITDGSCSEFLPFGSEPDSALRRGQIACGSGSEVERMMPQVLHWENASGKPTPVNLVRNELLEQFFQALGDRHLEDRSCMRRKVTATVIGRFDYERCTVTWVRRSPTDQPKAYGTGYGLFNKSRSQLVLQSVKDVVIGPINQCWVDADKKSEGTRSQ